MKIKSTIIFSAALLLSACSSINELLYKSSCTGNSWESVGEKDGERGKNDLEEWNSRCQQFGSKPKADKYEKGYAIGFGRYCQTQAYDQGKKGVVSDAPASCSEGNFKSRFEQGYSIGLHEFCTPDAGQKHATEGSKKVEVCSSVPPYQKGYELGLKTYCTRAKAFAAGTEKQNYDPQFCAANTKANLLSAYSQGKKLSENREKAKTLDAEINDVTQKIYDPKTPADAKGYYQDILNKKKAELKSVEKAIYSLETMEKQI